MWKRIQNGIGDHRTGWNSLFLTYFTLVSGVGLFLTSHNKNQYNPIKPILFFHLSKVLIFPEIMIVVALAFN